MNTFTNCLKLAPNLTMAEQNANKERFLHLINENITRRHNFDWLIKSDFFKAPCSTKYHLCVDGGLCQHSLNVYDALYNLCVISDIDVENMSVLETLTIVSLFHDLCKVNFYKRNTATWASAPKYVCEDDYPYGHGEKSVDVIRDKLEIALSEEEKLAIRWHMGAWDDAVKANPLTLGNAQKVSKLVTLLHLADMYATHITEYKL